MSSAEVGGERFDRRSAAVCDARHKFRKGARYSFAAFHGAVWGDADADVAMHDILWLSLEGKAARSVSVPLAATDVNSCAADLGDEPPRGSSKRGASPRDVWFWSLRAKQILDAVLRGAEPRHAAIPHAIG